MRVDPKQRRSIYEALEDPYMKFWLSPISIKHDQLPKHLLIENIKVMQNKYKIFKPNKKFINGYNLLSWSFNIKQKVTHTIDNTNRGYSTSNNS